LLGRQHVSQIEIDLLNLRDTGAAPPEVPMDESFPHETILISSYICRFMAISGEIDPGQS